MADRLSESHTIKNIRQKKRRQPPRLRGGWRLVASLPGEIYWAGDFIASSWQALKAAFWASVGSSPA
jgi:hypothetical protein